MRGLRPSLSLLLARLLGLRRFRSRECELDPESDPESDSESLEELESESESELSDEPLDDDLLDPDELTDESLGMQHVRDWVSLYIDGFAYRLRLFRDGPASFELPSFALAFSFSSRILFATPLLTFSKSV